jgi:hypothetical protein
MSDRRLICPHRRMEFTDGAYHVRCPDCGQLWVSVRPGDDTSPDATVASRTSPTPIDAEALAGMREDAVHRATLAEDEAIALRAEVAGWKKGVEDANKISQRERERADKAEAIAAKVPLLEKVVEAARWFSVNAYPPGIWKPEEVPGDATKHPTLGEGEVWAKRLNARLAALDGKKKAP